MSGSSGGDIAATWQGLAQIPQLLGNVRTGVQGAKAFISTPGAAAATGSPIASAAIWALGAELIVFIAQTIQAIDDDIDGLRKTLENYQQNEDQLAAEAGTGVAALDGLTSLDRPVTNATVQSCFARGVLTSASMLEDPARAVGTGATVVGNRVQSALRDNGVIVLDGAADAVGGIRDGVVAGAGAVETWADGREGMADLQGACAPAGAAR